MSRKKFVLFGIAIAFIFSFFSARTVFAEISEESTIYQKAFYRGVIACFDTNVDDGGLKGEIKLGDFDGSVNTLVKGYQGIVKTIGESRYAHISCKDLFTKKTAKKISTSTTSDASVKEQRLVDYNYSRTSDSDDSDGEACYSYKYRVYTTKKKTGELVKEKEYYTPQLCISKNENGDYIPSQKDISGQYNYNEAGLSQIAPIRFKKLGTNSLRLEVDHNGTGFLGVYTYTYLDMDLTKYSSESSILASVGNEIASIMGSTVGTSKLDKEDIVSTGTCTGRCDYVESETWKNTYYAACQNFQYYDNNSGIKCTSDERYSIKYDNQAGNDATYKKLALRNTSNFSTVVHNFSDGAYSYQKIKFSDDETYALYQYYLSDLYKVSNINCSNTTLQGAGEYHARLWWDKENKYSEYCYFDVDKKQKDIKVNGIYTDKTFGREIGLEELIEGLNALKNTNTPDDNIYANEDQTDTGPEEGDEVEPNCMNSGAMESLGWIICPALTLAGNWAKDAYENFVEPALEVDSEEIFAKNSSAVREEGWARFRDFANIAFIILFLVIIFSQLTGVGIDNYGIKKILPKLIVAALMINLSYVICVALVDISNIVGAGLKGLFDNINVTVPATIEGGIGIEGVGKGALTMVVVLFALVTGVWTVLADGGWVGLAMMLILAALSIIISLCFFFLILAAREAAIVVLVMISPLAVVAYMLPNTKNLFDRWWKMFKGLLMVYPICGLLVGGGDFVSRLLLAVGGGSFFSALAAMLVGVVPIFFIPKVLKSSLAMAGDIGAKIQGFGRGMASRARGGVENAVKHSEHAQQWKAASLDRIQARRNARGMRSGNARVRAAAVEREGARLAANAKVERLGDENGIQTRLASITAAEEAKAVDEATSQRLSLMRSTGGDGGIVMENGQRVMATRDNMARRMRELEGAARGRELSTDETQELGALARGLAGEKGGASQINRVVRNAQGVNGGANTNFMAAMSQIYQQDAAVAGKMKEKDGTMGAYMEQGAQVQYHDWAGAGATDENGQAVMGVNGVQLTNAQQAMSGSMGSYEAGLNQGGDALSEYIHGLSAADCQRIYDQDLDKILDSSDQNVFVAHAANLGVNGKSTTNVNVQNDILDVREAGIVADSRGSEYKVHRGMDGGVKDEGGFEVDLGHFNSR